MDAVNPDGWVKHRSLEHLHHLTNVHATNLPTLLNEEVVRQHDFFDHLVEDANNAHEVFFAYQRPCPLLLRLCIRGLACSSSLAGLFLSFAVIVSLLLGVANLDSCLVAVLAIFVLARLVHFGGALLSLGILGFAFFHLRTRDRAREECVQLFRLDLAHVLLQEFPDLLLCQLTTVIARYDIEKVFSLAALCLYADSKLSCYFHS
mmetsp:Transcript_58355/g.170626  ORF Transcript_58355/g.170626 Transcript_58355/m.170626 type:complete len:205 (-) Transcript_58355:2747-3361(-)